MCDRKIDVTRDIDWHSYGAEGRLDVDPISGCSKALREHSQSELEHGDYGTVRNNGDGRAKRSAHLAKTTYVSEARLCGDTRHSRALLCAHTARG